MKNQNDFLKVFKNKIGAKIQKYWAQLMASAKDTRLSSSFSSNKVNWLNQK